MSLAGRAAVRGETLTVHRPTAARQPDGSDDRETFALLATLRAPIETITTELARTVFGADVVVTLRALVPVPLGAALPDVQVHDGVTVTTGLHAGQRFRVRAAPPRHARGRLAHLDLALEPTEEAFDGDADD